MNRVVHLAAAICALRIAAVAIADSSVGTAGDPPSQPSAVASPQAIVPSRGAEAHPSAMKAAPADLSVGAKQDVAGQAGGKAKASIPADAQAAASKPAKKILVDDTVTDAELKQILQKGYRPEGQARGREVYYCRSEHELGSHFQTKLCRTAASILQDEQQGKEVTTTVERTGSHAEIK